MNETTSSDRRPTAVVAAVQLPGVDDADHRASIAELGRLLETLGYEVVGHVSQRRQTIATGTVLGEGKLVELAAFTGGKGEVPDAASLAAKPRDKARQRREALERDDDDAPPASPDDGAPPRAQLVAVDHDISPSQARNLERACDAQVLDRTGIIVEIFHRHARSREARLQVEIARLTYQVPRMRISSRGNERQQGKGAGESQIELDRRKVRDRIAQLREELERIELEQGTRRTRRAEARRVALVGYTNAGKSSLMRTLTGSDVYVADKLFATLDATVRALHPETTPRILVSDTVGFIKKLPHDLVASFRSTLDEAREASLLLFVADASDPTFRAQLEVTHGVLAEIGAESIPSRLILNKWDRVEPETRAVLQAEFPDAVAMSAHDPADVARLHALIVAHFDEALQELHIRVPYAKGALVGEIRQTARVLDETCDEVGHNFHLRAEAAFVARLHAQLGEGRTP
jgi:GTP-binding protein HflX